MHFFWARQNAQILRCAQDDKSCYGAVVNVALRSWFNGAPLLQNSLDNFRGDSWLEMIPVLRAVDF